MNGRGYFEYKISPTVEMTSAYHSDQREESCQVAEYKISPTVEMTNACHSDQREGSYSVVEYRISPIVEMTSACHSDQREESCQVGEYKISPTVEMTSACYSNQRDDCMDRYIAPAISAFTTSMWIKQGVEQCMERLPRVCHREISKATKEQEV